MSRETPEQVLQAIVDGINTGNLEALMSLYEPEAAFAAQPGSLARGFPGIRQSLSAFVEMKGTLDVLKARNACFLSQVFSRPSRRLAARTRGKTNTALARRSRSQTCSVVRGAASLDLFQGSRTLASSCQLSTIEDV